jgi:formylglycine-generating enzyme required for sulfatase activity
MSLPQWATHCQRPEANGVTAANSQTSPRSRVRILLAVLPIGLCGCLLSRSIVQRPDGRTAQRAQTVKTQTNSIGMKLVSIPEGSFLMGHPGGLAGPVHRVTVGAFWIGQYEVTNAQFDQYIQRPRPQESETDRQPAVNVSWKDAVDFCNWLSRKEGHHHRLPTEAEWECAARGGLEQKDYPWGDEPPVDRSPVNELRTMPVGSYAPNGFGLFDVAGNVREWVADWYDDSYYAASPERDPQGPAASSPAGWKVGRGGQFATDLVQCWLRMMLKPEWRDKYTGFRIVLEDRRPATSALNPAGRNKS